MNKINYLLFKVALVLSFVGCKGTPKPQEDAAPVASAQKKEDETIRMGLIASLTGKYSAMGSEDKKAVELAVEQVNEKGGLLGKKITLLTRDDQTMPDKSVLAYNDLKTENVVAVIGSVFSNSALAVEPLAQRDGMPYISLTPADEQVQPIKPYVFVVPALSGAFAERYLDYMQAQKIKKVAIAHDTKSAYAIAGYNAMKALAGKYGVQLVKDEEFETGTSDFSALFTHIKGSGAQAFVFWGSGPPGVTVTKQYAAANVKIPLFMTAAQASKLWLEPVGAAGEGVTVVCSIGVVGDHLPDGPQKQIIEQIAAPYRAKHGYAPPQFAQDGYSGALLLFEAIRTAGDTKGEKLQQALDRMTLLTPNGKYKYSATDHSGLNSEYIAVATVKDGKFVPTDWAKEKLARTVAAP